MKKKLLFCLLLSPILAGAQTYTYSTLVNFPSSSQKSAEYPSPPILDSSGNLYGVSEYGGKFNQGTVFKVTPEGKLSVLYSFSGQNGDGALPDCELIRDSAGNFYGSTDAGGANNSGTIFKLSPSGKETVLYSFIGEGPMGPVPSLARDSAGNLYGYSTSPVGPANSGTVFQLTPEGIFTTLYSFCPPNSSCPNGYQPVGGPVIKSDGNLYGVTNGGGTGTACIGGCGVIFELTPAGQETVLHQFTGGSDGGSPNDRLTADARGDLYATTYYGGTYQAGTIVKFSNSGEESVLYNFCNLTSGCLSAYSPVGPVTLDSAGNIYGVASEGNIAVYEVAASGKPTSLFARQGPSTLNDRVVTDKAGNLYGSTVDGGPAHFGTVFKLTKQK
jgi:uncharacterized repeat protein (TIGR03803 family)